MKGTRPDGFGVCTACGNYYPVHRTADGWHPVGTDGSCRCGNDDFVPVWAE